MQPLPQQGGKDPFLQEQDPLIRVAQRELGQTVEAITGGGLSHSRGLVGSGQRMLWSQEQQIAIT